MKKEIPHANAVQMTPFASTAVEGDPQGIVGLGGWTTEDYGQFVFLTSHRPPRPGAALRQLAADAKSWVTVAVWCAGLGSIGAGVAFSSETLVTLGGVISAGWLVLYAITVNTLRNGSLRIGVIDRLAASETTDHFVSAPARCADGSYLTVLLARSFVPGMAEAADPVEVLILYLPRQGAHWVVAIRPKPGA